MSTTLLQALSAVHESALAFTKFITPNDTGKTGGHQAGFHIHKNAWPLFFDKEGTKGELKDKHVTICWQGDFETQSRFIYYGQGTRNEYRLTRFGRSFPFLSDDNIGDLLVIAKKSEDYFQAYVLSSDNEIDEFLDTLNLSSTHVNGIVPKHAGFPTERGLKD
ncbi:MAG: hypothetical protein HYZ16_05170 [Bacteroidetes bacterium]|nr:hypothetical protein [Bacteroidota bacterium]